MTVIISSELDKIELLMKSFERPWFIAGGWTIDLALDEVTRAHKDMDICIFRSDIEYAISYFQDWDIHVAVPGESRLEPYKKISDLELPRYCLHLFKGNDFLEILATELIGDEVIFRKNRNITMHISNFIKGSIERPFVNPAWQLLFKSLSTRIEDEHDFKIYIERMNDDQLKKWLLESMIISNGNKDWIKELARVFEEGGDIL
ncbi:nucleotidyltransferase domain-containing protein [Cohnella soli]|uniref:Nucleotidyltransferase domain-containing protein n=1 Tax=Cohnella soli TaxID=425005 RepID=A0ABW0I210_9BACL